MTSSFPVLLIREFTGSVRSALSLFFLPHPCHKVLLRATNQAMRKGERWGCSISLLLCNEPPSLFPFWHTKTILIYIMKRADRKSFC